MHDNNMFVKFLCDLELLLNKISDDRKVSDPQPVLSESSRLTKIETVPHKVSCSIFCPSLLPLDP